MHTRHNTAPNPWIANAFSQMDDIFKNGEANKSEVFSKAAKNEDRTIYSHFIQENTHIMKELIPDLPHSDAPQMDQVNKERFLTILCRLAKEWDGISRQERVFLHQFWSGVQSGQRVP